MKADIGAASEFEEGKCRIFDVDGRSIGVVRWRDQFFAALNRCPHMGAQVCLGTVVPMLSGEDPLGGMVLVSAERPVLGCPWHGWQFDLHSGRAVSDERFKIRTYPVEIVGSRVLVEVPATKRSQAEAVQA